MTKKKSAKPTNALNKTELVKLVGGYERANKKLKLRVDTLERENKRLCKLTEEQSETIGRLSLDNADLRAAAPPAAPAATVPVGETPAPNTPPV